jgi:serine/threonine protein phosphatase 1
VFLTSASVAPSKPLYPPLARGLTIFAIGDIHGRADLLDTLHAAVDAARSQLSGRVLEVYLGDYVDRGPYSAETIELLLSRERHRELILLRGNHEAMLQQFLDADLELRDWARFGGLQTLLSYGVQPSQWRTPADCRAQLRAVIPPAHSTFLRTLLDWAWLGDYFFVHAGIRPGVRLEAQTARDGCWIRDDFLRDRRNHGAIVVHGHTTTEEPEFLDNRINLDTGAFLSGRLTCLRLDHEGARLFSGEDGGALGPLLSPGSESGAMGRDRAIPQGGGTAFATARPRISRLKSALSASAALIDSLAARWKEPVAGEDL